VIQTCGNKVDQHTSPIPEPAAGQAKILELLLMASLSGLPQTTRISHNVQSASAFYEGANGPASLPRVL